MDQSVAAGVGNIYRAELLFRARLSPFTPGNEVAEATLWSIWKEAGVLMKAGMVDLDGLKLADTSVVTLNAAGEVVGAVALMAGLRRAKPWLFGAASSSSVAAVPVAAGIQPKSATQMSHAEWQAGRKELLRRR